MIVVARQNHLLENDFVREGEELQGELTLERT
jgi:hypothetical protein